MPRFKITAPDGRKFEVDGPEGSTQEQALAQIQAQYKPPQEAPQAQGDSYLKRVGKNLVGEGELALNVLSSIPAGLGGGLNYLGTLAATHDPEAAKAVQERTAETLTYQPRGEAGQGMVGGKDEALGLIPKAGDAAGDFVNRGMIPTDTSKLDPIQQVTSKYVGPAVGALTNTAVQFLPMLLGGKGKASPVKANPIEEAAVRAQADGRVVPPNTANPSLLNNLAEGASGKIKTNQAASIKNQDVTQTAIKRDLGLADDAELSVKTLQDIRQKAGQAYEEVRKTGTIQPGQAYFDALDAVAKKYEGAAKDFKDAAKSEVTDLVNAIRKTTKFDGSSAVDMISILREKADKAFKSGDTSLGKANRAISDALETAIENHLVKTQGENALVANYRNARKQIAKTYSVQKAMNPTTGTVDAAVLARELSKGKPLTGGMRETAEFAQAFPKAAQTPERIGGLTHYSPLDLAASSIGEAASGNFRNAAVMLGRSPLRSLILSKPWQKGPGRARTLVERQREADMTAVERATMGRGAIAAALQED